MPMLLLRGCAPGGGAPPGGGAAVARETPGERAVRDQRPGAASGFAVDFAWPG
ncbi:hypothetical protein SCE1572_37910 [Sorangium cellulosum So0157-2]|uniref:Uncharacterized protein n=1 Tax=Sorangium cellulosum So0157-2 TaxID=1254432 RepID=S4Y2P4_SORCE|nr:hypothetical protein SCE1572_37910 [Sorangium cellulosum So0157-2]